MGFGAVVKLELRVLAKLPALCTGVAFDRHDDADADHHGQHGGTAMANEGKGDAGDRSEADDHQQIDHDVEEDGAGQARRNELPIAGLALHRDPQAPAHQEDIEPQYEEPADNAPLFGHGGKDEIGVAFGQIVEMALGAVAKPFAEYPARPDGDLGLGDMVACA